MFKIEITGRTLEEFKDNVSSFNEALFAEDKANIGEDPDLGGDGVRAMYPKAAPVFTQPPSTPLPTTFSVDSAMPQSTSSNATVSSDQELDADGVPWNAELHASSKAKTAKGKWRARRNVEKDESPTPQVVQHVGNETQVHAAPSFQPTVVASSQPQSPPIASTIVSTPATVSPQVTTSYENIAVPPTQKPAHDFNTFKANFVQTMMILITTGKITQEYIEILKGHFGVKEIWDITKNDQQTLDLFNNFVQHGLITKVG